MPTLIKTDTLDLEWWQNPNSNEVLCLSHSASGDIDDPVLQSIAQHLREQHHVVLFRMQYKQAGRKIPPRPPQSIQDFHDMTQYCKNNIAPHVFIGGRSYSGRVATHFASQHPSFVNGVVCLGFPLYPKKDKDPARVSHFKNIVDPLLIFQGQRDSFGSSDDLKTCLTATENIEIVDIPYADHSFKVRKKDPSTQDSILSDITTHVSCWIKELS